MMRKQTIRRFSGRFMFYSLALLAMLSLGSVTLTGCNTVEGAGEDIEAAGEGVQDAAD